MATPPRAMPLEAASDGAPIRRPGRPGEYVYTSLDGINDLWTSLPTPTAYKKINIYAIVTECTVPQRTAGGEFTLPLSLFLLPQTMIHADRSQTQRMRSHVWCKCGFFLSYWMMMMNVGPFC